ncbi:unc-93-like protein a [Plakobranchus ocellatus]|uniref:Unc-93-like protein a n=1 Tax=Plakobranchus ocellatus TaxID=259542 RepID=A0AAV4CQD0_9GAST|nr:unc-93-like protein a [Plakobranchus ocellatus]
MASPSGYSLPPLNDRSQNVLTTSREKVASANSSPGPRERFLLSPPPGESALSLEWADTTNSKNRRRSTIHSYTIAVYHSLPKNAKAMKEVRAMTSSKAAKNLVSISIAFMLVHTGFVSLQSLQSTLHPAGGLGLTSLAVVYGTTVLSCLAAPWLINRLTTKWTVVLAFSTFAGYFAASFFPERALILPMSVLLGALAGPMWSAQATYVTTLALTYAQHRRIVFESEDVINQFMGVFFGFFRCSQIWGNLISTLILARNETEYVNIAEESMLRLPTRDNSTASEYTSISPEYYSTVPSSLDNSSVSDNELPGGSLLLTTLLNATSPNIPLSSANILPTLSMPTYAPSPFSSIPSYSQVSSSKQSFSLISPVHPVCGAGTCTYDDLLTSSVDLNLSVELDMTGEAPSVADTTRHLLLATYLGCVVLAAVIVITLLDQIHIGKTEADPEFSQSSLELSLATVRMLKDTKCLLLMPMVLFLGLEQGFMFGDFTKAYVNCAMGLHNIGPILICFGTVSAISSIAIGCISRHIKRFAFIAAGATFNGGLLIVLWLWRPEKQDVPNFYVVSACLGLCDAIWQTQTYTLFGVLFSHKQEAAFASYRMFHAGGCAVAFGYSYFLCVQTKVFILAGGLVISLAMYTIIEMKVQLQSQHIGDIVAL